MNHILPFLIVLSCGQAAQITAPPPPDFQTRIEYVEWYNAQLQFAESDNAYQEYKLFMAAKRPLPFPPAQKAVFQQWLAQPRPWRSEEFPELAQWLKDTQPQLKAFVAGSAHRYYAHPTNPKARTVLEILDPGFTRSRIVSQALLLEAWQADQGFQGAVFVPRIAAVIRHAHHLQQGISTFEQLQAMKIRSTVYNHIVFASRADVLSLGDLEKLQAVLKENDAVGYNHALRRAMYHEVAGAYDLAQELCSTDGQLQAKFNQAPLSTWMPRFGKDPESPQAERVVKEDPKQVCDMVGKHYRFFIQILEKEYPKNLSREYKDRYTKITASSAFMQVFLANFERTFELFTTAEAKRRGTHLLVTLAIEKKKGGRWPTSLKSATPPLDKSMLKDPYSGSKFIYRVKPEGMTLYSVGKDGADNSGRMPALTYKYGDAEDLLIWPPKMPQTPKKTEPAKSQ